MKVIWQTNIAKQEKDFRTDRKAEIFVNKLLKNHKNVSRAAHKERYRGSKLGTVSDKPFLKVTYIKT